jgi:hypothetical protein
VNMGEEERWRGGLQAPEQIFGLRACFAGRDGQVAGKRGSPNAKNSGSASGDHWK